MTTLAQAEQLILEMINRARMDPAAEAARLGITLNQYIATTSNGYPITADPKQPLAGNNVLANVAESHTNVMISSGVLTNGGDPHNGAGDGTPSGRIAAAGYVQNGLSYIRPENVAWQGTSGAIDLEAMSKAIHDALFVDDPRYNGGEGGGHRLAMMDDNMREVGIGVVTGTVRGYNAVAATENFGVSGNRTFVTGAVYNDTDGDNFYGLGEALQGVTATVTGVGSDVTGAGGGWSVGGSGGTLTVTFSGGGLATAVSATVEAGTRNAKVDLVNGDEIHASATTTLGAGARGLVLLGMENINGTGNSAGNEIVGNKGNNILDGKGGNDSIDGGLGIDIAVFSGLRSAYQVTVLSSTSVRFSNATDGTDTISNVERFRFADVTVNFGDLKTTTIANTAPVATIGDKTLLANEWGKVSNWLSYSDAEGNAATQYQFWDGGTAGDSGYIYTAGNAHHAAGAAITVNAADLGSVWVRGGQSAGSETMYVRAFDGNAWGAWDAFTVATKANVAPVATIGDKTLLANEWGKVSNWLSYSDAEGNAATQYQFWDGGTAGDSGYIYTAGNAHHAAGAAITVNAADLGSVWVRGGQTSGSETMYVRAFDGNAWGDWDAFTVATKGNTAPVATIGDKTVQTNEWGKVSNWLSYSDAEGNAATQYQFWDGGTAASSGFIYTAGNAHHAAGAAITVNAADLGSVWVRGGQTSGTETMYVRAFDGSNWGEWDSFVFKTAGNTAPVATIADHSLAANQWSTVASWISYSDAENNAATQYEFWDGGTGADSGYFWTPGNAHHDAGTAIAVAASDLGSVWVRGGQSAGSETMYVRAFDGSNWSQWDSFSLIVA